MHAPRAVASRTLVILSNESCVVATLVTTSRQAGRSLWFLWALDAPLIKRNIWLSGGSWLNQVCQCVRTNIPLVSSFGIGSSWLCRGISYEFTNADIAQKVANLHAA